MAATWPGMLLFPRMTRPDLTGPYEVFVKMPGAEVLLLWKTLQQLKTDSGLPVLPHATLRDCPTLDVLMAPDGPGVAALM